MAVDDGGLLFEWRVGQVTYQLEFCADGKWECGADDNGIDLDTLTQWGCSSDRASAHRCRLA